MASRTIYPPIVNSFEPAFVAGSGSQLRVYFSFSALSTIPNLAGVTIHANIMRKDGVSINYTRIGGDGKRGSCPGFISLDDSSG